MNYIHQNYLGKKNKGHYSKNVHTCSIFASIAIFLLFKYLVEKIVLHSYDILKYFSFLILNYLRKIEKPLRPI